MPRLPLLRLAVAALAPLACAACGNNPIGTPDGSAGDGAVPDGGGGDAGDAGQPGSGASVLQFHKNPTRDGVYTDSAMTTAAAGAIHRDAAFSATLTGQVYAQPLYVEQGPGGQEAFIVATESNHVMAIGATGTVLWDKAYGTAASGGLPCGNIAGGGATLGITGTPIIDAAARTIYFDAMTDTGGNTDRHMIHAVSLDDGSEKSGWPVNVTNAVTGFDSPHENQRGALQLVGGVLYVPYGGHYGDCLPYYGWIVGVNVADPTTVKAWRAAGSPTWNTALPIGAAGIWATGGLPTDGTNIYASTGNSMNGGFVAPPSWVGGNAVFKIAPGPTFTLQPSNYYYPANWAQMDNNDTDLGGANPVLFDMPGAPVPHLVVALGKDGNLYLLNRDDLGGMGGELSITQVADSELGSSAAVYTTSQGTYVAFRSFGATHGCANGGNLGVAKIQPGNPPTASVVWCSKGTTSLGSPIVTTTDGQSSFIVWDANNRLYGYDGDTGALVFDGAATTSDTMADRMQYFSAPIDAKGRIVVATCGNCGNGPGNGSLVVFK
ncbi:MAG TPA: hypothetical protein VLM85_21080 [Polyangiaceae bacterium]|nr:hypothetical protein [Polyangiaceae bacterium]